MRAAPVEILWRPDLPIFSSEKFLKSVSDEYGWLGGLRDSGELSCILPYTIIHRGIFRMARFRTETILFDQELGVAEERTFLNSAMEYLRSIGADMVIPATANAIFRTYPDRAEAAPYGTYVIDLAQSEEAIWKNIDRITRQNINSASRAGIVIREARMEEVDAAYRLIRETFRRSRLPFMSLASFTGFLSGLGEYGKLLVADYQGAGQSYVVFGYSDYCAYAIYAGNCHRQQQGANKLLYWDAIRLFRNIGARSFDFFGTRIDPEKGSKQEALGLFKKRFGAILKQGYLWKYPFHPLKYRLYHLAARLRSGGDIVDMEKHKLAGDPMSCGS